jgi:metallo-beta-lactamase family protein
MKITFYGAAGNVTGSKHLIEVDSYKLLLDCGLHQGRRYEAYELNKTLPFAAAAVDAVIVSHAHADHCGLLPFLVKQGYQHKIYATPVTIDIAYLILMDAAKIQETDYRKFLSYASADDKPLVPLYSPEDVDSMRSHWQPIDYQRKSADWTTLNNQMRCKLYDAGHILGSAITVVQVDEGGLTKTVAYSGDLGNTHVPILPEPAVIAEEVETLILECTYGDKNHPPVEDVSAKLKTIIHEAVKNNRKIIVPAFALGRTQELIYILHKLYRDKEIPVIPIYLDSPLANDITTCFGQHLDDFDQQSREDFLNDNISPFAFTNLRTVASVEDSRALANTDGPYMVIASSGMMEGGRILHHLERNIGDPNAVILITGYQAEATLGRKLLEGISPVTIYGKMHNVKAQIVSLDALSAHADQTGLLNFIMKTKGLKRVFLVHTETAKAETFKKLLAEKMPTLEVKIPAVGDSFEL